IDRPDLGIVVEKVHFQSLRGLYVTGNLYRPRTFTGRLPAILYLCGHGRVAIDGVSYGNKAHYQHHAAWFARHGYVVLVIDTLQLGEIEGAHHGTYRLGEWWWVSRGYTPAGVEAWNSLRAIDLLASRPEVDPERIGVTGRSGGGIGTWWLAALDDRPQAFVPVAGITDLENHVLDGAIEGHCDCNYTINYYGWDYPLLAALAAPRPLLLSNSDKDTIFPLDGVLRVHGALQATYGSLRATDRLGLLITEGPHRDTQELQVPAFRWMARWLKGGEPPVVTIPAEPRFDPRELKVFAELPSDEINTRIQHRFVPKAEAPAAPATLSELDALRERWLADLARTTFRSVPEIGKPEIVRDESVPHGGDALRRIVIRSDSFELPIYVLSARERPARIVLRTLLDEEWSTFRMAIGENARGRLVRESPDDVAYAFFPPRGIGPTRWSDDDKERNHIRRRFLALGRTLAETRIFDLRNAVRALRSHDDFAGAELVLEGAGDGAVLALWAAIFEDEVRELRLEALPASHESSGAELLGVLRVLDLPQALSLVLPRRVILDQPKGDVSWALDAAKVFGESGLIEVR
ncbi:MAG TPA: prolyl oligopeptidase family serine peptidase, partial [Planctomycetota bacterium]|nr:prolyl oligopeptidase family serine peptidase [Planctomycetota bacterium]